MNQIKITNHQLFSLTANGAIGGAIIIASAWITRVAKQDAWITALITPAFGIPIVWMYWFLGSRYPGMTYVGITKKIFGKWIGFIVSAGFIFLCLLLTTHLTRNVSNFVNLQGYAETPIKVLNTVFVIAVVIAVLYGLEAVARASELFIYFVTVLFLITMLLVFPNARVENLQPVFEKGAVPILKGLFFSADIYTFPLVIIMMIYPLNIYNIREAKKSLIKGYLWASVIVFIAVLVPILVLGSAVTSSLQYPTFLLAKEINISILFTRLEFVIAIMWVATQFVTGLLYFYSGVIGLSELFGLSDHKRIVIPLGLIVSVMSEVTLPDAIYQISWGGLVWPPYVITYGLLLPVVLLLVFYVRKWIFNHNKSPEKS